MAKKPEVADRAADADVGAPEVLAKGYRDYLRYRLTLRNSAHAPLDQERDLIGGGRVVVVLPVDPVRDEAVLIRQFRLAAHLANGKGEMIEIVAGRVEADENATDAARRECREEIGVAPDRLVELFSFLTTPGLTDETVTLFVASVDAARVPVHSGVESEGERIETFRVPIDDALAALAGGRVHNGPAILALQWLALNRTRLGTILGA